MTVGIQLYDIWDSPTTLGAHEIQPAGVAGRGYDWEFRANQSDLPVAQVANWFGWWWVWEPEPPPPSPPPGVRYATRLPDRGVRAQFRNPRLWRHGGGVWEDVSPAYTQFGGYYDAGSALAGPNPWKVNFYYPESWPGTNGRARDDGGGMTSIALDPVVDDVPHALHLAHGWPNASDGSNRGFVISGTDALGFTIEARLVYNDGSPVTDVVPTWVAGVGIDGTNVSGGYALGGTSRMRTLTGSWKLFTFRHGLDTWAAIQASPIPAVDPVTPPSIMVSAHPSRTNASPLAGTVTYPAYVFIDSAAHSSATFYLDDALVRTDTTNPFDLEGP